MKNLKTSLVLILSSHLPMAEVQAQDATIVETKLFSQLPFRESPFADIRGIYPLSQAQAENKKHYQLSYDDRGRIVEVKFMQDGDVVPLNINRNVVTHAPHIKIKYRDNKEIRTFYNQFSEQTHSNGAYKEIYTLDEQGQKQSLIFEDKEGNRIESNWGVYNYQWQIDKQGTVVENRFNLDGEPVEIRPGFPFYCIKLHYDQRGWLALMENFGKDCKALINNNLNAAQDKLIYDANGAMISWNVYDNNERRSKGNSPAVAIGKMEYDQWGNTTREYYLDENHQPMSNAYGWTNSIATYDKHGNMTSRFNHTSDGEKSNNPQLGYSGYRLSYDKQGKNRTSLAYFDENNQPAVHKTRGYHVVKTQYDAQGRRSKIEYYDVNNNLVDRTDNGIAYIEYQYDQNSNKLLETHKFNKNNKRHVGLVH